MQRSENDLKTVAQWLNWSANEMKKCANQTQDPTLKIKFEQIAGLNKDYCDRLGFENEDGEDKGVKKEIEILKTAYFCQQSVFWRFSLYPLNSNSSLIDEIVDAQKTIVRQLYSEIMKRDQIS